MYPCNLHACACAQLDNTSFIDIYSGDQNEDEYSLYAVYHAYRGEWSQMNVLVTLLN